MDACCGAGAGMGGGEGVAAVREDGREVGVPAGIGETDGAVAVVLDEREALACRPVEAPVAGTRIGIPVSLGSIDAGRLFKLLNDRGPCLHFPKFAAVLCLQAHNSLAIRRTKLTSVLRDCASHMPSENI